MTTETLVDNRRIVVRVFAVELLRSLNELAHANGDDLIGALVFTAVWSLNTQHLNFVEGRYASMHDLAPDRERRPVGVEEIAAVLVIDEDLVVQRLDRLVRAGACERGPNGYVVPSAVFTQPEMMDGLNASYTGALRLVTGLQNAGFRTGERPDDPGGPLA